MMKKMISLILFCMLLSGLIYTDKLFSASSKELLIYSSRYFYESNHITRRFYEMTGIKISVVRMPSHKIVEILQDSNRKQRPDVIILSDINHMAILSDLGYLDNAYSKTIAAIVPAKYADPKKKIVPLARVPKVVVYNKKAHENVSNYLDLANSGFSGSLAMRSINNVYNQALIGYLLYKNSKGDVSQWIDGISANLAIKSSGNDRANLREVARGKALYTVVNTSDIGLMMSSRDPQEREYSEDLAIAFFKGDDNKTFINFATAGIDKKSDNKEGALLYVEYMLSQEIQTFVTNQSYEFPINEKATINEVQKQWGSFDEDFIPFSDIPKFHYDVLSIIKNKEW